MKILFDTKMYIKMHKEEPYMKLFLRDIVLRDSCYNCSFKKKHRISDITLADYWGIDKVHKDMNDEKGTSLVVINSDKGKELFELIKNNLKCVKTDLEEAIKYNPSMIKSVDIPKKRDKFFQELSSGKINENNIIKYMNKYTKVSFVRKVLRKSKTILKNLLRK